MVVTVDGQTETQTQSGAVTATMLQDGQKIRWTPPGTAAPRDGTFIRHQLNATGKMMVSTDPRVVVDGDPQCTVTMTLSPDHSKLSGTSSGTATGTVRDDQGASHRFRIDMRSTTTWTRLSSGSAAAPTAVPVVHAPAGSLPVASAAVSGALRVLGR
jgi:hypothetical protein